MRRWSVSSCDSPGPRVPMPPPSLSRWLHWPASRGSRYWCWASSTCSCPSRVRARRAKMSRIRADAVDDLDLEGFFQVPLLDGRQLVVEDDDVVVGRGLEGRPAPPACPCRDSGSLMALAAAGRSCRRPPPRPILASWASSSIESSADQPWSLSSVATATRKACLRPLFG